MANGFKTGGRKKGVENKVTSDIREKFNQLLTDNLETISDDLKELSPKDRINVLLQLSKFVLPQLKSTEITTNLESESPKINIIYSEDKPQPNEKDINISFT
ncbi:hypothetical protein OBK05_07240 [Empedobacter falsenii]